MDIAVAGIVTVLVVSAAGAVMALRRGEPKFRSTPQAPAAPLDYSDARVTSLCADLRALEALPIDSKEARKAWYAHARVIQIKLGREYAGIYDSLPHEIEHYLVDVDIRAKDAAYAEHQKAQLGNLLRG